VATVRQHFIDLLEPSEVDTLSTIFTRLRDALPVDADALCATAANDVEAGV
jgi:hypothetical protein